MPGSKLFVAQKQCSLLQLYGVPPSGRSHRGRYPMTRIYGHCWRGSSHLRAHAGNWTRPRWAADTFRSAYSGIAEKAQRSGYLEGPNVVSAAHCTTRRRRSSTSAIASKCNARVLGGTERMEHRRCTNCDSVADLISPPQRGDGCDTEIRYPRTIVIQSTWRREQTPIIVYDNAGQNAAGDRRLPTQPVPDYVSAFPVGDGTIAKEPDSDDRRRLLSRRCWRHSGHQTGP